MNTILIHIIIDIRLRSSYLIIYCIFGFGEGMFTVLITMHLIIFTHVLCLTEMQTYLEFIHPREHQNCLK